MKMDLPILKEKDTVLGLKQPAFCNWNVDAYQSLYPPEYWGLCRLFMMAHKTKYPEARLAYLTNAFYKLGVHGHRSDPKTERLVAALSVSVIEHFLSLHPGAVRYPFERPVTEDELGNKSEHAAENVTHGAEEDEQNGRQQDYSEMKRLDKSRQNFFKESSVESPNSQGSKLDSLEGEACSDRSQLGSSGDGTHVLPREPHSIMHETKGYSRKRVSEEFDTSKDSSDRKSGHSESKQRRIEPTGSRAKPSADHFKLISFLDRDKISNLLKGFIIIRDVDRNSNLNSDLSTLEDSFKRSKFGPCSWHFAKIEENKDVTRLSLRFGEEVLVEAEGVDNEFLQQKVAQVTVSRLSSFSPVIKAAYRYFNSGECRELPPEYPRGPCVVYVNIYTLDRLKHIIRSYAINKDFSEMIVLHQNRSADEFRIQDIIDFIDKEMAYKLRYRLAEYRYQGKRCRAICVFQIHDAQDLLDWLNKNEDLRYYVINKNDSVRVSRMNAKKDNFDSSQHENPEVCHSLGETSSESNGFNAQSAVESTSPEQPLGQPPLTLPPAIGVGKKKKNEELTWVSKEYLAEIGKSIYLVKFVKEDSTTENDPFVLLKSICSLAYTVDISFVMKQCENKKWHVSVVLKHDLANVLVGEARADSFGEARLAAAQEALYTIEANCKVVEPNFNYFAEGGVPRFISRKTPIKTSTYEIMVLDTRKTPLTPSAVNVMFEMFISDNSSEDIFFLASDFSSEERERICKGAEQFGLGWRLFGQRSRTASANDVVSTQDVCVFHKKTKEDVVQRIISCGGRTDKYCIVTRHKTTNDLLDTTIVIDDDDDGHEPALSDDRDICDDECLPGGCWNPQCSRTHLNILDAAVNHFLDIR